MDEEGGKMHYFQFNIKSYQAATPHLSNEEDLAYRRLIGMYYDTEQPIPTLLPPIARRLRVGFDALQAVLNEFFVLGENGWEHGYCDKVIASCFMEFKGYPGTQEPCEI